MYTVSAIFLQKCTETFKRGYRRLVPVQLRNDAHNAPRSTKARPYRVRSFFANDAARVEDRKSALFSVVD